VPQVLSGEGWNLVMYSWIDATNPAAALYFVALLVIGKFILLNMFLAVLMESFVTDVESVSDSASASERADASSNALVVVRCEPTLCSGVCCVVSSVLCGVYDRSLSS
jgi:hypothetical protein